LGTITIDGKTDEHDVVVRLSGEVVKRKKKLLKNLYVTSHVLSEDEARFLFERGQVVIGSGQFGNVHLSPEAEAYFERKGCEVLSKPTPEAIQMFNQSLRKEDRALSRDLLTFAKANGIYDPNGVDDWDKDGSVDSSSAVRSAKPPTRPARNAHGHHALKQPPQSIALTEAFVPGSAETLRHCGRRYRKSRSAWRP
jgi:hypothetical protein